MKLKKIKKYLPILLAVISGTMWFVSCPPYPFWWLGWLAMVPLYFSLEKFSGKKAFALGWIAGFTAMMGGFPWITDLAVKFGSLPWPVALFICIIYNSYQALLFGLFAWGFTWFRDHTRFPIWISSFLLVSAIEFSFPLIFPWYFAITQAFVPMAIQIAEFTGPIGVSALLAICSAVIYEIIKLSQKKEIPFKSPRVYLPLALLFIILGLSYFRLNQIKDIAEKSPKIGVAQIQPNLGIRDPRINHFGIKQILVHQKMSQAAENMLKNGRFNNLNLLVWSESSYPFNLLRDRNEDFKSDNNLKKIKRGFTTPLFMGAGTYKKSGKYRDVYNSALLFNQEGKITGKYDKNWLLIFGEYIPLYDYMPFMHDFFRAHNMSNMQRGNTTNNMLLKQIETTKGKHDLKIGPLICYEDILPSFSRQVAENNPHFMINITNDAWFGATQEPYQHFALSVYRTIETRRYLVRTVNIGVTAVVGSGGEVKVSTKAQNMTIPPTAGESFRTFRKKLQNAHLKKIDENIWQLDMWPHSLLVYYQVPLLEYSETFFIRFGNVYGWLMLISCLGIIIFYNRHRFIKKKEKKNE
jgi:apolipoprotein N-acyltransferase